MTILGKLQQEFLNKNLWESEFLDLGCGTRKKFDFKNKQVTGLDIKQYGEVDIIGDLNATLPISDESWKCIVAMNVYEHIHDIRNALAETYRILENGGRLLSSVPFTLGVHQAPYDFHRFTRFELELLLQKFTSIKIFELGTQFDTYKTIQLHLFMSLFTEKRSLFLKIVWNIHKLINLLFSKFFITKETRDLLGYAFIAVK